MMSFPLSISMALGKKKYIQYRAVKKILSENKTQQSLHSQECFHNENMQNKIQKARYGHSVIGKLCSLLSLICFS